MAIKARGRTWMAEADEHELLTLAEAAALTHRNGELLRRWCASGRIVCRRLGRDWVLQRSELDRVDRMPRRGTTVPRAGTVDDPGVLPEPLRAELRACLERNERVRAIAPGVEGGALVATDRRLFVARDGVLVRSAGQVAVWPLSSLSRVQLDLASSTGVLVLTPSDPEDRAITLLVARTQFARAAGAADTLRALISEAEGGRSGETRAHEQLPGDAAPGILAAS